MKILFVANIMNHFASFHIPYMNWFHENGWEVDAAANDDANVSMPDYVRKINIPVQRSPYKKENIKAFFSLKKIIEDGNYDIVHCHTPMGSVLSRLAVKRKSGTRVLYTCHGFQFFKGGPIKDWLLYYPVEFLLAKRTDCIITINRQDYRIAKRLPCRSVRYIPGIGVNLSRFYKDDAVRAAKRAKLKLDDKKIMLLSVGELSHRKNHMTVIEALAQLKNPDIVYYIAGEGSLREELLKRIYELGLEGQVFLLGYRRDIFELLNAADIFAFPSRREGLGMAAIEAMAVGLPAITSNIQGIGDFSEDGVTGYVCDADDAAGFARGIRRLCGDPALRRQMGEAAMESARRFDLRRSLKKMTRIYREYM